MKPNWLVVSNPLKNISQLGWLFLIIIWENETYSKPPTSKRWPLSLALGDYSCRKPPFLRAATPATRAADISRFRPLTWFALPSKAPQRQTIHTIYIYTVEQYIYIHIISYNLYLTPTKSNGKMTWCKYKTTVNCKKEVVQSFTTHQRWNTIASYHS